MPVLSSNRFSTTTGNSFLPPSYSSRLSGSSGTTSSLYASTRQPQYRSSLSTASSSGYGSRSDDSSRFGVSRYTSRSSYEKPPTGSSSTTSSSRFRSESRSRDYSLDGSSGAFSGYSSSPSATKSDSNSYHNTKRQSSSSLARSVATSGADLYEKYSPSHYIPKCELSRSRSLSETTSSKLASADISNARSLLRSASRDRDPSSPVNSSALTSKVKKSVPSLATHNCTTFNSLHPSSNNNNLTEPPAAVTNTKSNNPKVFICSDSHSAATAAVGLKNSQTKKATAVLVNNSSAVGKIKSSLVSHSPNSVRNNGHSNVTDSMFNNNNNNSINNNNSTLTNQSNHHHHQIPSKSSEFLKITGVRPLTVDRSFLRHECELARSQVVCSGLTIKSRDSSPNYGSSSTTEIRPNRRPIIKPLVHQTNISISLKSDVKKSSDELNNNNSNMNCLQKSPDLLDDIKYIDSDDSERKNSPTISKITTSREYFNGHISSTLPPPTTKTPIDAGGISKYNTLTNPRSGHQTNGVGGPENGLSNGGEKRFAFGSENGSRSTSPASRQINKRNDETATDKQKLSGDVNGSVSSILFA